MAVICPAILAENEESYHEQMAKVAHFAHRIQIDLTDGMFAEANTVRPEQAWWPVGFSADFHLMYKNPAMAVKIIMEHKPHMIIVHAESEGDFKDFAGLCRTHDVKVGVALLQRTHPKMIIPALDLIDHVLIFSGDLGHFGGRANLGQLKKIDVLRQHKPELEIGWDGGVDDQNVAELITGGVDVLNVGGYIQNAQDPAKAFAALQRIADETGAT